MEEGQDKKLNASPAGYMKRHMQNQPMVTRLQET